MITYNNYTLSIYTNMDDYSSDNDSSFSDVTLPLNQSPDSTTFPDVTAANHLDFTYLSPSPDPHEFVFNMGVMEPVKFILYLTI